MKNDLLCLSKDLVVALEQNDDSNVEKILEQIAGVRESLLFQEVGRLTRQLHDTMVSFSLDSKIAAMAESDIPDAKERLHYVIAMTEQAANQTLTVVEDLLPVSDQLSEQAQTLSVKWGRFLDREMPLEEFKAMSHEISAHFDYSKQTLQQIQSGLTDILMAQGFQDITGQIIRRVIDLVQDLETSMVKLISFSSLHSGMVKTNAEENTPHDLPGPVVPGVDDKTGDVATNQVDVDDLLSSLGF
jgi:chemotaxis protein CheZ